MNPRTDTGLEKIDFSLIVMQGALTFLIVFVAALDHDLSRDFLQRVQIPSIIASALTLLHFCLPYDEKPKDS